MKKKLPKLLALVGGTAVVVSLIAGEFVVAPPAPPEVSEDHDEHQHVASIESLAGQNLGVGGATSIAVPRKFLKDLPEGLVSEVNVKRKKQAFAGAMLPLILRANERIALERTHIIYLQGKMERIGDISARDQNWLTKMCKRYRVRKTGDKPDAKVFAQLLEKVDVIPPSLALAQAAIESGWGTSNFAQDHNALYGEWTWDPGVCGVVPRRRPEGMTHRIRCFEFLYDAVDSYMRNLNRHKAYKDLRDRRAELRRHNLPLTGAALAPALLEYSEMREEYVSKVLSLINYNDYHRFDSARLETA